MRSTTRSMRTFYTIGALAFLGTMGVAAAQAKSSGLTVTTTGSTVGTVVQGTVTIANSTSKAITVTAITETLEVRYATGTSTLPPGSSSGFYVVARLTLPVPGPIAAHGTATISYGVDTCSAQVARYGSAKDMRSIAAVTAAGQVTTGRSPNFIQPSQTNCPVCGNGRIEAGEQCDGGACCASCRAVANGSSCSDGNACTRVDQCQGGACVGGSLVVCVAADQCHTAGTCNPVNGTCSNPNKANGATCDDGNACSIADRCANGTCVGSPMSCSDGNGCTDDLCIDGTCAHNNNSAACDDGLVCTDGDICADGACTSGSPRDCDDSKVCTDDTCEETTACGHVPTETCDGCFVEACLQCQDTCMTTNTLCATGCWEGFYACLNGCTSTYCAPFCQVDLGYCLAACPDVTTCDAECEAGNGCGIGCTQPQ